MAAMKKSVSFILSPDADEEEEGGKNIMTEVKEVGDALIRNGAGSKEGMHLCNPRRLRYSRDQALSTLAALLSGEHASIRRGYFPRSR